MSFRFRGARGGHRFPEHQGPWGGHQYGGSMGCPPPNAAPMWRPGRPGPPGPGGPHGPGSPNSFGNAHRPRHQGQGSQSHSGPRHGPPAGFRGPPPPPGCAPPLPGGPRPPFISAPQAQGFGGPGGPRMPRGPAPPQGPQHAGKRKRGGGQSNGSSQQKKKKVDKRELPENNQFYCDICDRGFKTNEKFTEHVDGHEKCRVEDCAYVAAPKLVRLHYDLQHRTGMAKKIWQLESKEDINQWIDSRKKNFPTKANVAQKRELQQEKRERGEILETQYFGKFGRGRGGRRGRGQRGRGRGGRGGQWGRHGNREDEDEEDPGCLEQPQEAEQTTDAKNKDVRSEAADRHPAQNPMEYLLEGEEKGSRPGVEQDVTPITSNLSPGPPPVSPPAGALGTLACAYGASSASDDESDDVLDAEGNSNRTEKGSFPRRQTSPGDRCGVDSVQKQSQRGPATTEQIGSEQHGDRDTTSGGAADHRQLNHDQQQQQQQQLKTNDGKLEGQSNRGKERWNNKRQQGSRGRQRPPQQRTVPIKRLSLLQKLLAPDIRHERNIILQCIRHIVRKDFLGVEPAKQSMAVAEAQRLQQTSSSDSESVVNNTRLDESRKLAEPEVELWDGPGVL